MNFLGFKLLDLILLGIMVFSGLLALMRGFTREVLSLVSWGVAALAAYFAIQQKPLLDFAMQYVDSDTLAKVAVGVGAFLPVLIIISLISVKISDLVVDSAAGAFDRTLGFFFGVARGFLLVVIAYLFYGWFAAGNQEPWVRDAKSLPIIKTAGNSLCELMPADICETLRNSALQKQEDLPASTSSATQDPAQAPGYQSNDTQALDNVMQGVGDPAQKTDNPQNADQGNGQ